MLCFCVSNSVTHVPTDCVAYIRRANTEIRPSALFLVSPGAQRHGCQTNAASRKSASAVAGAMHKRIASECVLNIRKSSAMRILIIPGLGHRRGGVRKTATRVSRLA